MGSKAQHPSMPSARKTAETRIQIIGPGGSVDQGLDDMKWARCLDSCPSGPAIIAGSSPGSAGLT